MKVFKTRVHGGGAFGWGVGVVMKRVLQKDNDRSFNSAGNIGYNSVAKVITTTIITIRRIE